MAADPPLSSLPDFSNSAIARDQLAEAVARSALVFGEFKLRSGIVSDRYFDKYQFEARPELLAALGVALAELVPYGVQVLAGLELGGVPLASAVSLHTGIPCAFVRKAAKEYGTRRIAEGTDVAGRRVCVVEDVITTGGQVVASTEALREAGAQVDTVVCVIDRSDPDAPDKLAEAGLERLPLFRGAEFERYQ
ncbi:MAG TPA: orotate phosphoribosyltransferase [Solirubrobacteraceae bacterium]|jgi:orotate phosphoribosyltransferase